MPIDVEWQDERGSQLARYCGPLFDISLLAHAPTDSVCLRFIDPYGYTTFNSYQIEMLESELTPLADDTNPAVASQAKGLLAFIQQMQDRDLRFLKFSGD